MINLIVTIFLGPLGVHKFMQKKTGMGFLYLFTFGLFGIGWIVDIVIDFHNLFSKNPKITNKNLRLSISVVGEHFYKNEIASIMSGNRFYFLPDDEFIRRVESRKRIYRFKYREAEAVLVPEPSNPHDKNAIMVLVDKVHVGYIPADQCIDVKKVLPKIKSATAEIHGGDYKYHTSNDVFKTEDDFSIDLYLKI